MESALLIHKDCSLAGR